MDAGEYETNTLLISNLSAISFRIYEPIAAPSSTYTFNASGVEHALRSDGHLVYMDAVRRGIWCFYLSSGDPTAAGHSERLGLHARMEVCGYPLGLVGDGNLEPIGLLKNRPLGTNAINTPSSSSSAGSALDANMRSAQPFSFPPTPVVVDGKVASTPVGDVKGYGSVPAREIHEFFITAVLSSLTAYFCRTVGAILLNSRSALLPPQAFNSGSLVISLHVSVLQGLVSSADVLRSSLLHAGPTVLAAPFGTFGTLQGVVDTESQVADGGYGQSPDTQVSRLRPDHCDKFLQLKTTCCKLLQMSGMSPSLLDGCSWLNIHFLQRKPYEQRADGKRTPLVGSGPTAPWPAVLCFRKPKMETMLDMSFEKALSGTGADHLDPLNKAKMWCQGVSEREAAAARRKKEREVALAREHADPDVRGHPQTNGYSPMALWRSSANGGPPTATGTMYPTPPDGVQPSGVTPSFDGGQVQSPAGQPAMNALGDAHTAMQQDALAPGLNAGWDGAEPRPEQTATNFSEDNLFGDLGEDMFEGNELTDADFNFFDEHPGSADMDLSGLPEMGSSTMGMQENGNHQFAEQAQAAPSTENRMDIRPVSPQFTKPELRHARSTLAEENRQQTNMESFNRNSTIGIKRNPSPFNPETVFKRIRASIRPPSLTISTQREPGRRRSLFEKVDFDPALSPASKKYEEKGPFDYTSTALKEKESRALQNGGPLTTGRLLGSAQQRRNLKELPPDVSSIVAKLARVVPTGPRQQDDARSESDDGSSASSDEDTSDRMGHASSPAKSSVVRRRPEDDVISMAASFRELEHVSADSPGYGPVDLSRLSNSEIPDFSLSKYFADPEPVPLRISASDDDFITVAQILTEQAASGFLRLAPQRPSSEVQDMRRSLVKAIRYSIRGLQKALPRSLAGAAGCQLRPFTEVQDVPLLVQPNGRVQVRPAEFPKPSIFLIPTPHVELRRYENQLSVLPSAVSFWDTLGLGPVQGPKSVVAVCIFPQLEGMRDNTSAFLDRVQSTYESLRLGAFERLPTIGSIVDSLVLLPIDHDMVSPGLNLPRARSAYTDQMTNLAMSLAGVSMSEKNFVVYFAYTPENPGSIVDSCSAFQELFEHYKRCMMDRKKHITNELVLQLVPLDAVASETSLVVLSPAECTKLCLETYDRCTLFGGPMPSPAIMLERALPRGIDFKLAATPSPNLLRENSCIHVAYARSVDERWVTAAWTDNRGSTQSMASYCLGRRGKPLSRVLGDVIHEIWETTHDLISTCKVHWRVVITKCGPMEQHEMELWTGMAQAETRATVSLVLLTVDTDPSLQLIPPAATIPLSAPSVFYTTPVSTPQPLSVVSPDQFGNPSTPMGNTGPSIGATTPGGDASSSQQQPPQPNQPDADGAGDTTLVDTAETTWGVVVSHRLNNSASLTDLNPALASGYLVKRAGPRQEDAPVAMEVNVVYSDNARAMYDVLLREMLAYFRGLGTLARVRGVTEREVDVRPWHVAVVEKAVRVLYLLM
ncbi:mediator complex subunit 13 C-terminal-domain-containing protein [Parachaetomium inaequale]|uniref:Mediator of RNA polymerase II transcription subunit 13 n=1 Tax=Parachaetomium inaequale TaxID=2588326 RepID=A0AAN6PR79_9PEZI|nr:mediator complex subunit 13 C-terminal-domain-containing protein [Parachaetomium inaequale]